MNYKDIQIGKYYSMEIWEDDDPLYLRCVSKEDNWFIMKAIGYENCWEVYDQDHDSPYFKEMSYKEYMIQWGLFLKKYLKREFDYEL